MTAELSRSTHATRPRSGCLAGQPDAGNARAALLDRAPQWGNYDIGDEGLAWAIDGCPSPDELRQLVVVARRSFGWFSKQPSRAFEYPWVLGQLGENPRGPVLDIGAGISPLPICLAMRGAQVVTVDHSPVVRSPEEDTANWTGWGFFDYSRQHSRIRSLHAEILDADFAEKQFAAVYSVSVIEHMRAADRRALWSRIGRWLDDRGVLLLSVDLARGTERLWNRSQGEPVEADIEHGDMAVLGQELAAAGLRLAHHQILRDLRNGATDCAMMRFERN